MPNLFIGVVKNNLGEVIHSHFSEYSDDSFNVEIYEGDTPIIVGEFRKFHHFENLIKKNHPNLTTIRYDAGEINPLWLINVLKRSK